MSFLCNDLLYSLSATALLYYCRIHFCCSLPGLLLLVGARTMHELAHPSVFFLREGIHIIVDFSVPLILNA
jgi:hypothetical protein